MTKPGPYSGTAISAEFIPDGDPYRDNQDDAPRPAGTYLTVKLDNDDAVIVSGKVTIRYEE